MARGRISVALSATALALACASVGPPEGPEPVLMGPLSRAEIEAAMPAWVEAQIEAEPDAAGAERLDTGPGDARVTVYLGTWCSDSRRELARLWRAFDEAGGEPPFEISYIGVDRKKRRPRELVRGVGLEYVPTFVVERGGAEAGRIVEQSPNGIELDLAALVYGETAGVVSAREDLGRP
jgi:hypothetical protein